MALKAEIYAEFEAVVGKNNISQSPAVLETYRCALAQSSSHCGPYRGRTPMPQAVILPGNTEEVQEVVKLCNKYRIKFKASSSFWSAVGYIGDDYSVQIDMRRMTEITIDPVNMIMTVESCVNACMAQAEAMKYGLMSPVPGCGASSCVIPNTVSWVGGGSNSIYVGASPDCLLCAEWVLPDGTLVRTGSAGAGAGWFCGDGPGFSNRALFRGMCGTTGDMGICTKISLKLSPWPGPKFVETEGLIPGYRAKVPENIKFYDLCFPTWEKWARAVLRLGDSEAVFAGHRQFSCLGSDLKAAMLEILLDPDKQLCDLPELLEKPEIKATTESQRIDMGVVITGMTPEDMEWKEEAIQQVLQEFDGWLDPRAMEPDMNEWMLMFYLRLGHKNLNFVYCGGYEGHLGLAASNIIFSAQICEEAFALRKKWFAEGHTGMANIGGDSALNVISKTSGAAGFSPWEFFGHFDPSDEASVADTRAFFDITHKWMGERNLGPDFCRKNADIRGADGYCVSQEKHNEMYAKKPYSLPEQYQWKMNEAFNPNKLNSTYYRMLDPKCVKK